MYPRALKGNQMRKTLRSIRNIALQARFLVDVLGQFDISKVEAIHLDINSTKNEAVLTVSDHQKELKAHVKISVRPKHATHHN